MKRPLPFFALVALVVPLLGVPLLGPGGAVLAREGLGAQIARGLAGTALLVEGPAAAPSLLEQARLPQGQQQLRIERRVVIRVSPSNAPGLPAALAVRRTDVSRGSLHTRFEEVEHGACVAVDQVSGVQPIAGNRLLIVMRDHRLLTASLDRHCAAQAFYAGFYVERHADGLLCVARDRLQSRAGGSCAVAGFSRLVTVAP